MNVTTSHKTRMGAALLLAVSVALPTALALALDLGKIKGAVDSKLPPKPQVVADVLGETSEQDEIAIGRQVAGDLLGASPLVADPELQQYVNRVGRWVASQSDRPDLPWHFGVLNSPGVNAFATPGGNIFVTRGLYALLRSESELAGVLGHEIGHVVKKHHLKILQKARLLDMGSKALGKQVENNEKAQQAIGTGAELAARKLDQTAEFEADRVGVALAARAGYDPYGLPTVLQQLGQFASNDGSIALLFKTHPHPDDRLKKLDVAIGDRLDKVAGQSLANRLCRLKPSGRPRGR